jgi:Flp pilus assembly protein TadB
MTDRHMRLLKLFARNVAGFLLYIAAMGGYWTLIIWLDWPYGFILAVSSMLALVLYICWYVARNRLAQLERQEQQLADRLSKD